MPAAPGSSRASSCCSRGRSGSAGLTTAGGSSLCTSGCSRGEPGSERSLRLLTGWPMADTAGDSWRGMPEQQTFRLSTPANGRRLYRNAGYEHTTFRRFSRKPSSQHRRTWRTVAIVVALDILFFVVARCQSIRRHQTVYTCPFWSDAAEKSAKKLNSFWACHICTNTHTHTNGAAAVLGDTEH